MAMMEEIWLKLKPETREVLIANPRGPFPANIIAEVRGLADVAEVGEYWVTDPSNATQHFTPEVTNWIEQKAKGE